MACSTHTHERPMRFDTAAGVAMKRSSITQRTGPLCKHNSPLDIPIRLKPFTVPNKHISCQICTSPAVGYLPQALLRIYQQRRTGSLVEIHMQGTALAQVVATAPKPSSCQQQHACIHVPRSAKELLAKTSATAAASTRASGSQKVHSQEPTHQANISANILLPLNPHAV
jgi:hypothetical protein